MLACERGSGTSPGIRACGKFSDEIVEHALLATRDRSHRSCVTKTLIVGTAVLKEPFAHGSMS